MAIKLEGLLKKVSKTILVLADLFVFIYGTKLTASNFGILTTKSGMKEDVGHTRAVMPNLLRQLSLIKPTGGQVFQFRIVSSDQVYLPFPVPVLQIFFSSDCVISVCIFFIVHKIMALVF